MRTKSIAGLGGVAVMHQSSLIRIQTRDEIEVEQLPKEIQAKREQIAEMTIACSHNSLEICNVKSMRAGVDWQA